MDRDYIRDSKSTHTRILAHDKLMGFFASEKPSNRAKRHFENNWFRDYVKEYGEMYGK